MSARGCRPSLARKNMVVIVRIELDDEQRRALNRRVGRPGLATREHVRSLALMALTADLEDAVHELRAAERLDDRS